MWIVGFTGPLALLVIESVFGHSLGTVASVFWFYALISPLAFIWGGKSLPETNGRTVEEITEWRRRTERS